MLAKAISLSNPSKDSDQGGTIKKAVMMITAFFVY